MVQVKLFDCDHEKDLENAINYFLENLDSSDVIDIKYSVSAFPENTGDQIYCFTAMVVYHKS
ncbi:sporulation protein Cse60 [Bacillus carboniphilus]|uniref:Sporulation protein Cse60 n=1 Tax=Bacillus carboniphilus TaxID=86663 RepID=A0ABN0WCD6_9BACI